MTIRNRRRQVDGNNLESMTDWELEEIRFFGNLTSDPETIVFQATLDQQRQAARILAERRVR